MIMCQMLDEPLISVAVSGTSAVERFTLPALYSALARDRVTDFCALRPHQRHVLHAFLVQVAALALHKAEAREFPGDDKSWRELLLGLTPDDGDGAAWALVGPHDRPALLQPAITNGDVTGFKRINSPDALDMLVTSKNHDIKREVIRNSRPEHWFYALLSLQTQEGFLGAGNYGISRMNGGFANRPGFGIVPPGGPGRRVVRDVAALRDLRKRVLDDFPIYPSDGGIGLVWLEAWDGAKPLAPKSLDPFYVEICRRVRLVSDENGSIAALATGTKAARIDAKALRGRTGDPWTPLVRDADGRKALTLDSRGLSYKRLVPLVFPSLTDADAAVRAPLQVVRPDDDDNGLTMLARTVVRGQGGTEGFHERSIPVSRPVRRFMTEHPTDEAAAVAASRVADAGLFGRKVLYPAALAVSTAAPSQGERNRDDDTAKSRAGAAITAFEALVDATFFSDLEAELNGVADVVASTAVRNEWLLSLREHGRTVLSHFIAGAPKAAMRDYRTQVRARDLFERTFRRQFGVAADYANVDRVGSSMGGENLVTEVND